jgi:hypothetical protein
MHLRLRARLASLALGCGALAAAPAGAMDRFEIQVYDAEIDEPFRPGLELHVNYTARGTRDASYPGEVPPDGVLRATFEPALALTDWLELGAYLQTLRAPGESPRAAGAKLRVKLVVPERMRLPVFLGLNMELSRVPSAVEPDRWGNEFRPIVGVRGGRWTFSVNPIFGWSLTGPDRLRADLEPCAKVSWDTHRGFTLGAEWYSSLGPVDGLLPWREQEHVLFGVLDLEERPSAKESPWELNFGFGGALTSADGPHLLGKAIVGRSF